MTFSNNLLIETLHYSGSDEVVVVPNDSGVTLLSSYLFWESQSRRQEFNRVVFKDTLQWLIKKKGKSRVRLSQPTETKKNESRLWYTQYIENQKTTMDEHKTRNIPTKHRILNNKNMIRSTKWKENSLISRPKFEFGDGLQIVSFLSI